MGVRGHIRPVFKMEDSIAFGYLPVLYEAACFACQRPRLGKLLNSESFALCCYLISESAFTEKQMKRIAGAD